ncbi:hypothetical protein IE81DRAFT_346267 [Ceraceosorus guamensis]|uniref:Uncharacterized protein n=1 Tax=Ceraceosorus guamensis TaxID=1522189 RepID=A0A316W720_9BASI|nr:hypothetical protein IE81DRAFT_346267 [Ceraceosorus guamensis]PWN43883.1 hypothetical protein IE81DRAFT_346267 [Ceraceosorus guamensis]
MRLIPFILLLTVSIASTGVFAPKPTPPQCQAAGCPLDPCNCIGECPCFEIGGPGDPGGPTELDLLQKRLNSGGPSALAKRKLTEDQCDLIACQDPSCNCVGSCPCFPGPPHHDHPKPGHPGKRSTVALPGDGQLWAGALTKRKSVDACSGIGCQDPECNCTASCPCIGDPNDPGDPGNPGSGKRQVGAPSDIFDTSLNRREVLQERALTLDGAQLLRNRENAGVDAACGTMVWSHPYCPPYCAGKGGCPSFASPVHPPKRSNLVAGTSETVPSVLDRRVNKLEVRQAHQGETPCGYKSPYLKETYCPAHCAGQGGCPGHGKRSALPTGTGETMPSVLDRRANNLEGRQASQGEVACGFVYWGKPYCPSHCAGQGGCPGHAKRSALPTGTSETIRLVLDRRVNEMRQASQGEVACGSVGGLYNQPYCPPQCAGQGGCPGHGKRSALPGEEQAPPIERADQLERRIKKPEEPSCGYAFSKGPYCPPHCHGQGGCPPHGGNVPSVQSRDQALIVEPRKYKIPVEEPCGGGIGYCPPDHRPAAFLSPVGPIALVTVPDRAAVLITASEALYLRP